MSVITGFVLYAYLKDLIVANNVVGTFVRQTLNASWKIMESRVGKIV